MISINGNDSRQSKVPRDRREIVGRQSPVRGDGPFFLVAFAAAEPLDALGLSASPQSAMIYFLSSSFLFSLRELIHLRNDISPFAESVNSSPSFFSSVSPVEPEEDSNLRWQTEDARGWEGTKRDERVILDRLISFRF